MSSSRIRDHIRSNVVGYIAIFMFAMGGTAYATHPGGANTISSGDIQDNQVFSADVRNDTLAGGGLVSADVRNDTQTSPAGGLGAVDLKPSSVGTSEVALDSLGAGDLAPSSVGTSEVAINSLGAGDLASSSVGTDEVAADSLEAGDLASSSVGDSEVLNGSLGTAEFSSSIPAAYVGQTTGQSIPDGIATTLAFNTESSGSAAGGYDTASMHDNVTDNSRLTAPVTGIYDVTAGVAWAPGTGRRELFVLKNGSLIADDDRAGVSVSAGLGQGQSVTTPVRLGRATSLRSKSSRRAVHPWASPRVFAMNWLAPGP